VGHWDGYVAEVTKYYPLLDLLDAETADRLARGNILRVLKAADEAETVKVPKAAVN